jgi:hypothetical protein
MKMGEGFNTYLLALVQPNGQRPKTTQEEMHPSSRQFYGQT